MRKSVEEKSEQRRDNEARPADSKDRSAHLAARGKSLLPLAALSKRALDDDEFMNALQEMHQESDRGAAIMGAALLEEGLRKLIEAALENMEEERALFDDQGAPFYSLHAKTIAAFGMGLVDKQTKKDIDIVRGVRNQFSHALRAIKFSNETISSACEPLSRYVSPDLLNGPSFDPRRARFIYESACLEIWQALSRAARLVYQRKIASVHQRVLLVGASQMLKKAEDGTS